MRLLKKKYGSKIVIKAKNTADVIIAPAKEAITEPEPPEAAAFPRLQKVKVTLDKHNNLIEVALNDLKGLAKLTKKRA